jgi:hypothetical protein
VDALWLIALGCVLLCFAAFAYHQPRAGDQVAYWQKSVANLDETPDRFFAQVFQALREGLNTREVALTGMGFGPQKLFENRSVFSHRPLYLCAQYKHLTYYLYVSQTPVGLFLSTRMYSKYVKGSGEGMGIATLAARRYFAQQTMFQHDALLMFQESVHSIVLQVLDRYMQEQGLQPLEEYERRPIYHAFYSSAFPPRPYGIPQVNLGLPGITAPTSSATVASAPTAASVDHSAVLRPSVAASANSAMPQAGMSQAAMPDTEVSGAAVPLQDHLPQAPSSQAVLSATASEEGDTMAERPLDEGPTDEDHQDEASLIDTEKLILENTLPAVNTFTTGDNITAQPKNVVQHKTMAQDSVTAQHGIMDQHWADYQHPESGAAVPGNGAPSNGAQSTGRRLPL